MDFKNALTVKVLEVESRNYVTHKEIQLIHYSCLQYWTNKKFWLADLNQTYPRMRIQRTGLWRFQESSLILDFT
jgi:hypothetical protein